MGEGGRGRERLKLKTLTTSNAGENVEQQSHVLLVGTQNGMEDSVLQN